jgi:hypothetical protein
MEKGGSKIEETKKLGKRGRDQIYIEGFHIY